MITSLATSGISAFSRNIINSYYNTKLYCTGDQSDGHEGIFF